MDDYLVALDPALGVSPTDFVSAWNGAPDCREAAEARTVSDRTQAYDLTLGAQALAVLGGLAMGVAGNALYDLIKRAITGRRPGTRVTVVEQTLADGRRLLVVTVEE